MSTTKKMIGTRLDSGTVRLLESAAMANGNSIAEEARKIIEQNLNNNHSSDNCSASEILQELESIKLQLKKQENLLKRISISIAIEDSKKKQLMNDEQKKWHEELAKKVAEYINGLYD